MSSTNYFGPCPLNDNYMVSVNGELWSNVTNDIYNLRLDNLPVEQDNHLQTILYGRNNDTNN